MADAAAIEALRARMAAAGQARLGHALAIRHLDAGDCGGCVVELAAIRDLPRYGLRLVESPRHADVLLVTGPVTRNLRHALEQAWRAMAEPKFLVALGDCAIDGGVFKGSAAVHGGVAPVLAVDLAIRGCPPSPAAIVEALCALLGAV